MTKPPRRSTAVKTDSPAPAANPAATEIVVGVGASAGGLEALRSFVGNLPTNMRMTYIVAQHLSPAHDSLLTELLGRETHLPVVEASDDLRVEPNTIYVTPQNTNIKFAAGRLKLLPPSSGAYPKPSVDVLLMSIAEEAGEQGVAIVLSGTGSDGALGLRAVKAAGGCTYAQDDESAKYNGMPHAAIATGCVDFVLPPERIADELVKLAEIERDGGSELPAPDMPTYEEILKVLRLRTGTDFTRYKENTVRRRLQRRMVAHHFTQLEAYLDYIRDNPEEVEKAAQDILISVTSFFRDPEAFAKLEQYLKKILETKQPGDELRIWVPGCATGEEAYSIALLLYEQLGTTVLNYKIQIFATDIDLSALARARKATFHGSAVSGLRPALLRKYFRLSGDHYVLNKAVRDLVVIARQDITEDPPFLRLDLISCRNLLIYFKNPLQNKVLEIFHYALREGGYLFLGKSESAKQGHELFQTVDAKARIYQRTSTLARIRPAFKSIPSGRHTDTKRQAGGERISAAERMRNALIGAYAPDSVLIDSRLHILQVHGNVHPYLRIPEGDLDWQLNKLLRRELRLDVRSLVGKAKRDKTSAYSPWVSLGELGKSVRLAAHPLQGQALDEDLYLVSFEPALAAPAAAASPVESSAEGDARVAELEDELATTRDHLQTAVEELETSNEELQSVNEELQSANEELQSTNEELETANEELQSTNEELTTVNDELQLKSAELLASHTDLENVKDSLSFALVVVDAELRVRFHNPIATKVFKFSGRDSHPLITNVGTRLDLPHLRENIQKVIKSGVPFVQQIEGKNVYLFSIVPYRQADKKVSGAILTFVDNSAVLRSQRELRESQAALFAIISNSPLLTYFRDLSGKFVYVSAEFERRFGLSPGAAIGKTGKEILPPDIARFFARLDNEAMQSEEPLQSEDVLTVDGISYAYLATRFVIRGDDNNIIGVVTKAQDITERKSYERRLWLQSKALQESINGVVIADAAERDMPIIYVNQAFENLTGYSEAEVLGKNCRFLQQGNSEQEGVAILRNAIRMHRAGRALLVNYRKDGSPFWNEVSVYPVKNDKGKLLYYVGTQIDVSARIESEKALAESRERLRAAQEFARTGDFQWVIASDHIEAAESLRRMLNLPLGELKIDDIARRIHPADAKQFRNAIDQCKRGTQERAELEFRAQSDGATRWFHLRAHRFEERPDRQAAIVGLIIDIQERKQAEEKLVATIQQLRRSNQDLEEFVYVASHDLKEPLRKLTTFTDLVQRRLKTDDETVADYMQRIRAGATRMERFIEDLLAYSQLTGDAQFSVVDLNTVVQNVCIDLETAITESKACIEAESLPTILGNATQMGQLFSNLISNSIKYCKPDTPPQIKIACSKKLADNGASELWEIVFSDNGIGFDNTYADQVFSVFRRLHDKDAYQGTGIGLAICRKVAHRHGGEILASGEPGKGARFTLQLPIDRSERRETPRSADSPEPDLGAGLG